MGKITKNLADIIRAGFVPILVKDDFDPIFLCEAIRKAGLPVVEFALRRDDLGKIPLIRKKFSDLILLIGSMLDEPRMVSFLKKRKEFYSLDELFEFGVDGFVSILPFRKDTYRKFSRKLLLIPGVETRGEAMEQLLLGAHLVKFVGVSEKELKATDASAHSLIPVFYTGGVTLERIDCLVQSGVLVLAAGFDVILGEEYGKLQRNPDEGYIIDRLVLYKKKLREARKNAGLESLCGIKDDRRLLSATARYLNI